MIPIHCKSLIQRLFLILALLEEGIEKMFSHHHVKRVPLSK